MVMLLGINQRLKIDMSYQQLTYLISLLVEQMGLEPTTSALRNGLSAKT